MKRPGDRYKTALVTGGGSGLGEAMCHYFAKQGYAVAVTDIDEERAGQTAADIQRAGGQGFACKQDVTSADDWTQLQKKIEVEWGGLGVLVNNAGVAAAGNLEESSLQDWQWVLDIDLMGVVRGCHQFLPMMRRQNYGHIVNVASFAGLAGAPGIAAYGTAKAGVVALSEQLRAELAGSDVSVSVLCPAFVQTNLLDTFRSSDEKDKSRISRWMQHSGVTAEDVAEQVYQAVANKQFLILTHKQTRWAWRLKRWLPKQYFKLLVKQSGMVTRRTGDE